MLSVNPILSAWARLRGLFSAAALAEALNCSRPLKPTTDCA